MLAWRSYWTGWSLLGLLLFSFACSPLLAVPKLIGDLNDDGEVNVLDVVRMVNFLGGRVSIPASDGVQLSDFSAYPPLPAIWADMNEDGVIDQNDVALLEQVVVGLIPPRYPTAPPRLLSIPDGTNASILLIKGSGQPGRTITAVGDFSIVTTNTGTESDVVLAFPLATNRLNRVFVTSSSDKFGPGTPQVIEIVHDVEPPNLFVDFPPPTSEIATNSIVVAGRIGDTLSGWRGLQAWVTNRTLLTNNTAEALSLLSQAGGEATVNVGIGNNGTFMRSGVPVLRGTNLIEITGRDVFGNTSVRTVFVVRVDPAGKPRMFVLSGDGQTTNVHLRLSGPIRVKIVKSNGSPVVRKVVTFEVTRSDGRLTPTSTDTNQGALIYQVETDAQGIAEVSWRLGGDAGCGNNRVCASSRDVVGRGYFFASALSAPASQINVGSGNNQKVETGNQTAETLRAWVSDSLNGVSNIVVTYQVSLGRGGLRRAGTQDPWTSTLSVRTGLTGHAAVEFQAGPEAGVNEVQANFLGNRFLPAVFVIHGVGRDSAKQTRLTGLVLDNTSRPIGSADCLLEVDGTQYRTATDVQGWFSFINIIPGRARLDVDGQSATTLYSRQIGKGSFPSVSYLHTVVPNAENSLAAPVVLPRLNSNNIKSYYGTNDLELTCEGIDGLKMRVKAGSLKYLGDGTIPVRGDPIRLALDLVHHDQIPMPTPDGASPLIAWTLQPTGAVFDPPIQVEYPNISALPAGSIAYFWGSNPNTGRFEIISTGHVSADATTILTDQASGLAIAGWWYVSPPYSATGSCEKPCECPGELNLPPLTDPDAIDMENGNFVKWTAKAAIIQSRLDALRVRFDVFQCQLSNRGYQPILLSVFRPQSYQDHLFAVKTASTIAQKLMGKDPKCAEKCAEWMSKIDAECAKHGICKNGVAKNSNHRLGNAFDIRKSIPEADVAAAASSAGLSLVVESRAYHLQAVGGPPQPCSLNSQTANPGDASTLVVLDQSVDEYGGDGDPVVIQEWLWEANGFRMSADLIGSIQLQGLPVLDQSGEGGAETPPDFMSDDFVRVIGYSNVAGTNRYAQSGFFRVKQGQSILLTDLTFTNVPPRKPESLLVEADVTTLARVGRTSQMRVIAKYADGSQDGVSPQSPSTSYHLSDPSVIGLDKTGLLTAKSSGWAYITAVKEGASAVTRVDVPTGFPLTTVIGYVQDGTGSPVMGAKVAVNLLETTVISDARGRYVITNVPAGLDRLTLAVSYSSGAIYLTGSSVALDPFPGGMTDAGFVVVRAEFPGLVYIPPGRFIMGSPRSEKERLSDEVQHEVTLTKGFWMGQREVTQGEYLAMMGVNPSYFRDGQGPVSFGSGGKVTNELSHPVEQVSWMDAVNYCGKRTQRDRDAGVIPPGYAYRLPTEAEWEYACRGGTTNAFGFGPAIRRGMANFSTPSEYSSSAGSSYNPDNEFPGRTVETASYGAKVFGLYDMHGNVFEWCSDWYDDYPSTAAIDPKGPAVGGERVVRGGAFGWGGTYCRAAYRNYHRTPDSKSNDIGFRVVLAPSQ